MNEQWEFEPATPKPSWVGPLMMLGGLIFMGMAAWFLGVTR